ncbi:MAG: exodeoxyribonuclease VII small subunit [Planctomycetota bacterium]
MGKKKVDRGEQADEESLSFEQAMAKLDETVSRLEDGELGLDESLLEYERGIKYLKQCYSRLERAQRKIELLAGIGEDGEARGTPFDESELSLEEKQASRGRRRSRAQGDDASQDGLDESGSLF